MAVRESSCSTASVLQWQEAHHPVAWQPRQSGNCFFAVLQGQGGDHKANVEIVQGKTVKQNWESSVVLISKHLWKLILSWLACFWERWAWAEYPLILAWFRCEMELWCPFLSQEQVSAVMVAGCSGWDILNPSWLAGSWSSLQLHVRIVLSVWLSGKATQVPCMEQGPGIVFCPLPGLLCCTKVVFQICYYRHPQYHILKLLQMDFQKRIH